MNGNPTQPKLAARYKSLVPSEAMASEVWFDSHMMHVRLLDGREISVPIEWFPRLRDATEQQRKNWRLISKGVGIHWEDLDEDISVAGLLKGRGVLFRHGEMVRTIEEKDFLSALLEEVERA